ncbi:MAG: trypsin-like peptidase domain-containing protein [Prevotella sp.]|jgi:hypothetical protein|nr:trypsin-like peptidase domain-containing protein [Prevotella sp.]
MNLNPFKVFAGVFLFIYCVSLSAQTKHYNFNNDKSELSLIVEKEKMKQLVVKAPRGKHGTPLLELKLYKLNIKADTVGVWSVLPTKENVWKLTFNIPDAKGFKIGFDDFYLPEGSLLYVYNKENSKSAVVYKHDDNPKGGSYSIENLRGDNVVLEYVASTTGQKPRLLIADIGYKYLDDQGNPIGGFGDPANSCMIDINCPEANLWSKQKKGVLRLRVNNSLCSGTLVNNTNEDKTPYVLTAYHCFQNVAAEEIANTEFFFDYEKEECEGVDRPTYKYHKGAESLVLNPLADGSDGALLKLSEPIPDKWDVYYNGWDRSGDGNAVTSGAVIHHPRGDVKKITFYDKPLTSGKWDTGNPDGSYWVVSYSLGSTEEGSSGAPIFNQDGLVVGTLTGGNSSCSTPASPDYYGKFRYHWDQSADADLHMSKYLDPNNRGVTRLEGLSAFDNKKPDLGLHDIIGYIENDILRVYAKDLIRKIRVIDLFGSVIYAKSSGFVSSVHDIPVSGWSPGVYILSVDMDGRSTKSIKILK